MNISSEGEDKNKRGRKSFIYKIFLFQCYNYFYQSTGFYPNIKMKIFTVLIFENLRFLIYFS